jgi:DnaK suppressor protein
MLTQEQTNALRAHLQAELARLADHAHVALDFTMDRDRDRIGRDSMDESAEEELYSTLRRLDKGEIDECVECAEAIGYKRLMARPMTTLCFECKTAAEQVEAEDTGE